MSTGVDDTAADGAVAVGNLEWLAARFAGPAAFSNCGSTYASAAAANPGSRF